MQEMYPMNAGVTSTRSSLDLVSVPTLLSDPETGRVLYANRRAAEILGRREEVLARTSELELYHRPEVRFSLVDRALRRGEVEDREIQLVRGDGSRFWALASAQLVEVEGRRALSTSFQDIDRSRREREASERRRRRLLSRLHVGVARLDTRGRLLEANRAFLQFLGTENLSEARALPVARLLGPQEGLSSLSEQVTVRGDLVYEASFRGKHGRQVVARVVATPGRASDGRAILDLVIEDIAERRSLEAQLHHSQKMEAIGRLAGGIAHDFNNVLSVIRSCSLMALEDLHQEEVAREDLHEISRAVDRANALTRRLLAFSRKEPGSPERFDLSRHVRDAERMLQRILGSSVETVLRTAPEPLPIRMDPHQLEIVLLNLAVNARDAMPDGGTLSLTTGTCPLDGPCLETLRMKPGPYAELRVIDTGVGMDAATQEHIFEPFFTTKAHDEGTGLGLSTCYGIVHQAGGYLRVDSEPGEGTTFRLLLPLDVTAPEEKPEPAPTVATAMVVDDDPLVRRFVAETLQRGGYKVLVETTAEDARRWVRSDRAREVDLLITEVETLGIHGLELATHLLTRRPDARLLCMSGREDERLQADLARDPAAAFIAKPFKPGALLEVIADLLDDGADPAG
ncbi:MAG: ATP-binding protein [Myxococcota bacterium]